MALILPAPVKAWLTRVASTLSCNSGRFPASRSRWNSGGITSEKVSIPASIRASICAMSIWAGGMKYGGRNASATRRDSGEASSSTIPIVALLSDSGMAVALT